MRGPGLPEMVRDGMHAVGSTGRADRGDRRSLWRRSEEIVDLVKKSKEGHTAGDARVLSMASEWVSIRAHQSPSEPIRAWRLNGFQATRLVRSGAEVGIELRRV